MYTITKLPTPKPSVKKRYTLSLIAIFAILLMVFILWYYQPKHYSGNITLETIENKTTLNIQMDIYAHRSLFRPTKFSGKLIVNNKEYTSYYKDKTKDYSQFYVIYSSLSSALDADLTSLSKQYDENNIFENLIAKIHGEQQIPAFLPPGSDDIRYGIFIENLQEVFLKKDPNECNLTVHICDKESKIRDRAMTKPAYEAYLNLIESTKLN